MHGSSWSGGQHGPSYPAGGLTPVDCNQAMPTKGMTAPPPGPIIPLLGLYPTNITKSVEITYIKLFTAALVITAKVGKAKCPSRQGWLGKLQCISFWSTIQLVTGQRSSCTENRMIFKVYLFYLFIFEFQSS